MRANAIVLHRFGGPEVLEPAELELAPPGPGEVQLRVRAVALNPVDLLTRRGAPHLWPPERQRFPLVIGWDAAGEVEAVGPGVTAWQPGDRVIAMSFQPRTYRGNVYRAARARRRGPRPVAGGRRSPRRGCVAAAGRPDPSSAFVEGVKIGSGSCCDSSRPSGSSIPQISPEAW